nr:cytochrome c oxidase subunit 2 [Hoplopleura edentula]
MTTWSQLTFHNGCSSSMLHIEEVHDWVMVMVVMIVVMNLMLMINTVTSYSCNLNYFSNEALEFVWVLVPSLILFALAIPSLHCLYLMEEVYSPGVTIKAVGHQWYWSYEYGDASSLAFDSYLTKSSINRLLEVDMEICMPLHTEARVLVSSADVLHSWAVPSLGVKADAIPGRINQISVWPSKVGVYYGQCSEMCGAMHSFMPIRASVLPLHEFTLWILNK